MQVAVMKRSKNAGIKRLILSIWLITNALILPAQAGATECRVADPTGTPLNVRTIPGGRKIVEKLKNGTKVTILDSKNDWAYVGLISENDHLVPTGWVYRKYLDCTAGRIMSDPD